MSTTDLTQCTADQLLALYRSGQASPVEATQAVLARIENGATLGRLAHQDAADRRPGLAPHGQRAGGNPPRKARGRAAAGPPGAPFAPPAMQRAGLGLSLLAKRVRVDERAIAEIGNPHCSEVPAGAPVGPGAPVCPGGPPDAATASPSC